MNNFVFIPCLFFGTLLLLRKVLITSELYFVTYLLSIVLDEF